jgi:hypothetical protein
MEDNEGLSLNEKMKGFKWMGSKNEEMKEKGKNVIFEYEEEIGLMCGKEVMEKDGI